MKPQFNFLRDVLKFLGIFLLIFSISTPLNAGDKKADDKKMTAEKHRYLILTPHTPEECLKVLDDYVNQKPELLNKLEWGCKTGDHTGYLIVEALNEKEVRDMFPAEQLKSVKIEELTRFTIQQIRDFHEQL